jgi:signal transduction histidine kinase
MSSSHPKASTEYSRRADVRGDPTNCAPEVGKLLAGGISDLAKADEALVRCEKLASLGRLASTIAHEINNPLASVMNLLYLAKNHPDCPQAVREDIRKAESELLRVSQLTRQTLSFYRDPIEPILVSLPTILDEVLGLFETVIMAKGVEIQKAYSEKTQIRAAAVELRQVFTSLISNSLDAVQENGILALRIGSCTDKGVSFARATISDNGKGIERADMAKVFQPLFTTKESVGTGLGLWVAKRLVEKHGGSIRFRSSTDGPRRGTTFAIKLPLAPAEPTTS